VDTGDESTNAAQGSSNQGGNSGSGNGSGAGDSGNGSGVGGSGGGCSGAADCEDDDKCTVDTCDNGACTHAEVDQDDKDACTIDSCDSKLGVLHTALSCEDNNVCTTDACDNGACTHAGVDQDDKDACTVDSCDSKLGVLHTALSCDDNNVCTTDACANGACTHAEVDKDDNDACTVDSCDPKLGVLHTALSCDDNNPCTTDMCNPAAGCITTPITYFSETFANNSKGWTLGGQGTGTPWQVGPLIPNPTAPESGNPDPTEDHTPTVDNGVAGVAIGGNTSNALHPPYYLLSPIIDLTGVSTPVYVEFWRYLNSDFPPFMDSTVEVYNGSSWVTIFAMTPGVAIYDAGWTRESYDVTPYKNNNFQIRWGWRVLQPGVVLVSGWNIDDVRLIPADSCP
jgi:hypothetical protein